MVEMPSLEMFQRHEKDTICEEMKVSVATDCFEEFGIETRGSETTQCGFGFYFADVDHMSIFCQISMSFCVLHYRDNI